VIEASGDPLNSREEFSGPLFEMALLLERGSGSTEILTVLNGIWTHPDLVRPSPERGLTRREAQFLSVPLTQAHKSLFGEARIPPDRSVPCASFVFPSTRTGIPTVELAIPFSSLELPQPHQDPEALGADLAPWLVGIARSVHCQQPLAGVLIGHEEAIDNVVEWGNEARSAINLIPNSTGQLNPATAVG